MDGVSKMNGLDDLEDELDNDREGRRRKRGKKAKTEVGQALKLKMMQTNCV